MHHRLRLGAVLGLVAALTLTLGARDQTGPATAAAQLGVVDVLFDHADYRAAMRVYLEAAGADEAGLRDRARRGAIRGALRIGEYRVASTQAAALRASRPQDPDALTLWGDSLWASGLFDEAEAAYREAVAIDPGSARARNGFSRALASHSRLEEALREVRTALAVGPGEPELWHNLAQIQERRRDYRAAADALTRFAELLSAPERAHRAAWTMGQVHLLRSFGNRRPYEVVSAPGLSHVLPFKLVRDKVMVRARVNGRTMELAVDTGAEHMVMTVEAARRAGVRPVSYTMSAGVGRVGIRGLQVGVLDSLEVGTLHLRNVPVVIKNPPLRDLPVQEIDSFSPLAFGLSSVVDYGTSRLVMAETLPDEAADFALPLRMHRLATVRGEVDDRPASFIVDTGGEVISLNTTTANAMFRPAERRRIALRVYGASGLDPDAYLLPGVNLNFDEIEYRNTPVVVMNLRVPSALLGYNIGGIVGHKFLSRYRVAIDLQRNVVRLQHLQKPALP
ncbi:MAG TPA: aspartyl protease family protein [Vicinamibacterales bacterium]|nr:aspartyl protease family protein [Vicinamibacterales bacterium]